MRDFFAGAKSTIIKLGEVEDYRMNDAPPRQPTKQGRPESDAPKGPRTQNTHLTSFSFSPQDSGSLKIFLKTL